MSIQAVARVIETDVGQVAAKMLMICLANAHNTTTELCSPSIDRLAQETGMGRSTVKRWLRWLEEQNYLRVVEQFDGSSRQLANAYRLFPEEGSKLDRRGGAQIGPEEGPGSEPPGGSNCEPPLKEPEYKPERVLSETSSDTPSKAKKVKALYPAEFEQVWTAYPTDPNMSKKEAYDAWRKLSPEDRDRLAASVPAFKAYCQKNTDYRPIHLCRFIKYRRFDGFAPSEAAGVVVDDAQWLRRLKYARHENRWASKDWGPMPGQTGCLVPVKLLEPTDGNGWQEFKQAA